MADLLTAIHAFLKRTGMGRSYFGKRACGNSELVRRLEEGRPIQSDTADKVRAFMERPHRPKGPPVGRSRESAAA